MTLLNPLSAWPVTGSWDDHASYSLGGTDYPTPWGTWLAAPADGVLESVIEPSTASGATAGRIATFRLDEPVHRVRPASKTRMTAAGYVEAEGPMVRVVVQHLAGAAKPGTRFAAGAPSWVRSGDSGPGEHGSQIHTHIHGLDAAGRRLDFTKFIGTPVSDDEEDDMAAKVQLRAGEYIISGPGITPVITTSKARGEALARVLLPGGIRDIIKSTVNSTEWAEMKAAALQVAPPAGAGASIDYDKLAATVTKKLLDEQAKRLAG